VSVAASDGAIHLIGATLAYGASGGTRTRNLLITNQLLYQLSHAGVPVVARSKQDC
jgi:hypothetical protein